MRTVKLLAGALVTAALVYGIPVAIEREILRRHANPLWLCIVPDFPACAVLFGLGLRQTALVVYGLTALIDGTALMMQAGTDTNFVLAANLRVALRSLIVHEEA